MNLINILGISVALAMDAFSISICKGLTINKFSLKLTLECGLWFGIFQGLMPIIGYFFGKQFESFITNIDHWIAFGLLLLIGINMIRGALKDENEDFSDKNNFKMMFLLAIATSIDALAVGISFAFLQVNIWKSSSIIGATTFIFCFAGASIGNYLGNKFSKKAEIIGGIILILIGTKILLEHLGIIF